MGNKKIKYLTTSLKQCKNGSINNLNPNQFLFLKMHGTHNYGYIFNTFEKTLPEVIGIDIQSNKH